MGANPAKPSKAERLADKALVVGYHEARLAELLERIREGFERYDSGELDAFELDELIHRYKKAARELWKFHIRRTTGDQSRSSPPSSNKLICGESLSSGDPACPPVPRSPILKEILGKQLGL